MTILGSIVPTSNGTMGTELIFDLNPTQLLSIATGGLLTLRVITYDSDGVSGVPIFFNESIGVDYSSAPGLQPGIAPRLEFSVSAVPLPASLPLVLFGLGGMAALRRRRHAV